MRAAITVINNDANRRYIVRPQQGNALVAKSRSVLSGETVPITTGATSDLSVGRFFANRKNGLIIKVYQDASIQASRIRIDQSMPGSSPMFHDYKPTCLLLLACLMLAGCSSPERDMLVDCIRYSVLALGLAEVRLLLD